MKINKDKFYITEEFYQDILELLELQKGEKGRKDAKFKAWCRSHFKLQKIGAKELVYCTKKSVPLVTKDDIFDSVLKCHETVSHSGRDKTWAEIKDSYAGIKYDVVDLFLSTCGVCTKRQPVRNPPTGKPLINLEFLLRVQIDLIDFRTNTDARLVPCKVLKTKTHDTQQSCQVYSKAGIIKNWFKAEDLVQIKHAEFEDLTETDLNTLHKITLIQASRARSGWHTAAGAANKCNCKTSCKTKRCCCRKAGLPCGSKCHSG